jgi:hypothetical protein
MVLVVSLSMDGFLQDLKHSARMFLQSPGFTIVVIASLSLGIGANTAILTRQKKSWVHSGSGSLPSE